jgi:replication factor C small subunit
MWTEKYDPVDLDEVVGHDKLKRVIKKGIEVGDIPHFIFHGITPGTGKTIIANLIGHELLGDVFDVNWIPLDGSNDRSVGKIRPTVMNAIKNATINGYLRIIFLDEADGLMDDAMKFLRGAMNNCNHTRFIFTCNDITQIIEPIQDRCMCFEFKPLKKDDIVKRLMFIRDNEKVKIEQVELERIAKESRGSVRRAITKLEEESMVGDDKEDGLLERYLNK